MTAQIPAGLQAFASRGPTWEGWLERLPRLVAHLLDEWQLSVDGASLHGACALVVPVRTADRACAVLKVGWPHEEAALEHLALRLWNGNGAARLLRADPHRAALLIERLEVDDLTTIGTAEACEVVAGLYAQLHIPASPQFQRLSALCGSWAERLARLPVNAGLPRRYGDRAVGLARELADDPRTDGTLIHTDLYYDNVLRADRQAWLAIDPKPLSGEPAFEIAPLLWNRWEEATGTRDVRRAVRERFFTVVDLAGLDEERAKAWVLLRMAVQVLWVTEDPAPRTPDDTAWITDCVTIIKAMED